MCKECCQVDNHSHTYQEIGDEECISHEFDVVHQWRGGRNEPVEHNSHQECPENALHTYNFHQAGTKKHQSHYKYILYNGIIVSSEEPASDAREYKYNNESQNDDLDHEPHPIKTRNSLLEHTAYHSQHQKCECVGHNGASHGNAYALPSGNSVAQHDGVGDECV